MNHEPNIYGTDGDTRKAVAVYTPLALAFYDLAVLGFSNSFVWQCSSHVLLDFYNQHISDKHLDIGVGTGYFLDKCRFPSTAPKIALFDLSPHSLAKSAKRLRRYNPSCYLGNALQPIDIGLSGFDSISLNYLLHCLPGNLASKSIVFEHVKPLLTDCGVIFGSTILGEGVRHNPLAKQLLKIYNARGIFSNLSDRLSDLEAGLKAHFDEHTIRIAGCVALFSARRRMARTVTGVCRALDETGAPVGVQQKLMRHAHVSTAVDQYGNASALAKRKANRPIVQRLLQRPANQEVCIQ